MDSDKEPPTFLELVRSQPRAFILFASVAVLVIALLCLASNLLFQRIVIAPDVGIGLTIAFTTFALMAWISSDDRTGGN